MPSTISTSEEEEDQDRIIGQVDKIHSLNPRLDKDDFVLVCGAG